jgi:hypothetical protein
MADSDIIVSLHPVIAFISMIYSNLCYFVENVVTPLKIQNRTKEIKKLFQICSTFVEHSLVSFRPVSSQGPALYTFLRT